MRLVSETYAALGELYGRRDRALAHLPLAGAPWEPAVVLAAYVWLVFVALPRFMRGRRAFGMRTFMLWYNAGQVLANAFMTVWVSERIWGNRYCNPFFLLFLYLLLLFQSFCSSLLLLALLATASKGVHCSIYPKIILNSLAVVGHPFLILICSDVCEFLGSRLLNGPYE